MYYFENAVGKIEHCGTEDQFIAYLHSLGYSPEEIAIAVQDMKDNNTNIACFGVFRRFLYSKRFAA